MGEHENRTIVLGDEHRTDVHTTSDQSSANQAQLTGSSLQATRLSQPQPSQAVHAAHTNRNQQPQPQQQAHSASSMWVQFLTRSDSYAPSEEERAEKAGDFADRVVKEFAPYKGVGLISSWRRKKAYVDKKRLYDSTTAQTWRQHRGAPQPARTDAQVSFNDPAALNLAARQKIHDMMNEDFLGYTDDRIFVENFSRMYAKLKIYEQLNRELSDPKWSAPNAEATLQGFPSLEHYTIADIRNKAEECVSCIEFYEAKMDMLTNPFYLVLRKSDTEDMSKEELERKAQELSATSPELSGYLLTMAKFKRLKDEGVERKPKEFKSLIRADYHNGYDKNVKGHFAIGTLRKSVSVTGPNYGMDFWSRKAKNVMSYEEDKSEFKKNTDITHNGGLEAEASLTFTMAEGKIEKTGSAGKYGVIKGSADAQLGEFKVYGKAGASVLDTLIKKRKKEGETEEENNRRIDGYIGAEAGATATLLKGKIAGSIGADKFKWYDHISAIKNKKAFSGIKLFGVSGSLSADAFKASAYAAIKAGKFDEKKDKLDNDGNIVVEDGQKQTTDEYVEGGVFKAGVSASLVSGKAKGELTIFGVKLGVQLTGTLGSVGASVGAKAKGGKIGVSLGAGLGAGFKLGFYVDASAWVDILKSQLISASEPFRRDMKHAIDGWLGRRAAWFRAWRGIPDDLPAQPLQSAQTAQPAQATGAADAAGAVQPVHAPNDAVRALEQRVNQARSAENHDLVQRGEDSFRPTGAFQDPDYSILLKDSSFKAGQLENTVSNDPLFGAADNPFELNELSQRGDINDCYLMASLASLAMTDPDYITNTLVKQDQDPEYAQVRLYDEQGQPQIVRVRKTKMQGDNRPLWVQMVEKASLTFVGKNPGTRSATFRVATGQPVDRRQFTMPDGVASADELNLGSESIAYRLLFGKGCNTHRIREDGHQLADDSNEGEVAIGKLLSWCSVGKKVTASTDGMAGGVSGASAIGIRGNHVYTVLGEGTVSDRGERTVKVRDPYADVGANGVIDIPFDVFKRCFTNVTTIRV